MIPARGVTSIKFENRKLQEFAIPARVYHVSKFQYPQIKKRCGETAAVLYYRSNQRLQQKKQGRTSNMAPLSTQRTFRMTVHMNYS